jgi:hypothetical protein
MKLYYDTKSGLKLAQGVTLEMQGQTVNQIVTFDDYRDVKALRYRTIRCSILALR